MNKHQQRTEATTRRLLNAASKIFARDGFEAARIEQIAAQAGYTRGAFYANFKTKADLFFALLEERFSSRVKELQRVLEEHPGEEDRIRVLRDHYAAKVSDVQWSILVLEFKLYALRHPKLRAKLAESHRRIRAKMQLGGIQRLLPARFQSSSSEYREAEKVILEIMLNGVALEHAYDPQGLPQDEASRILRMLFDLLIPTAPDKPVDSPTQAERTGGRWSEAGRIR